MVANQMTSDCNNGGHAVFTEGTNYLIGTALDLTFLKHIDLGTRMTLKKKLKN